jgi:hypothetical protein
MPATHDMPGEAGERLAVAGQGMAATLSPRHCIGNAARKPNGTSPGKLLTFEFHRSRFKPQTNPYQDYEK